MSDVEKEVLFREFGSTFEKQYIPALAQTFFDGLIDSYKYTRKPYRGGKPGDICLALSDQVKFILEIKSGRANDNIKIGTKKELVDKYIYPKNSKGKIKGILQAINDAKKLRNELFTGEIFTGIVFYDLPLNDELDRLIEHEIGTASEYQGYLKNSLNHPSIWLDIQNYELILSAVQQGASLYNLLKKISGLSPSKIRRGIVKFMIEAGIKPSTSNLYSKEIQLLKESCLPLLISDDKRSVC